LSLPPLPAAAAKKTPAAVAAPKASFSAAFSVSMEKEVLMTLAPRELQRGTNEAGEQQEEAAAGR
jgi:hypothetical protein